MRRGGAGAGFVCVLLLAQLCLAGDCVDGVTPDCSDAATQCGPNLDRTAPPSDAAVDVADVVAVDAGDQ